METFQRSLNRFHHLDQMGQVAIGLSIVSAIARAHDAVIVVDPRLLVVSE